MNQPQFSSLLYTQGLALEVQERNTCRAYERTRVQNINKVNDYYAIEIPLGVVKTKLVIHATHTPKGKQFTYYSFLGAYREYGIAAILIDKAVCLDGIFWCYYNIEKYSFKTYSRFGKLHIKAIGKAHRVGQKGDNIKCVFELTRILNRWPNL